MKSLILLLFCAGTLAAQTNGLATTNPPAAISPSLSAGQHAEQIRTECIQGRRIICGRILKVLPAGLVVDSGYTDLMRKPLNESWLVPGTATATRPANLVERREPESVCVGVVFLTDIPKSHGAATRPKPYDYVILMGYPAGLHTYTSVGDLRKTVRRFSANLQSAVRLNLAGEETSGSTAGMGK